MQILIVPCCYRHESVCGHNWCCFNHLLAAAAYERRHDGCVSISVSCLSPLSLLLLPPSAGGYTGGKHYNTYSVLLYFCLHLQDMKYLLILNPHFSLYTNNPGTVSAALHCPWCGGVCRLLTYLYQELGRGEAEVRRRLRAADSLVTLSRQLDSVEP